MTEFSRRAEELIAAAVAQDLSPQEQIELDALRSQDPSVDAELRDFMALLPELRSSALQWQEDDPPHRLGVTISELTQDEGTAAVRGAAVDGALREAETSTPHGNENTVERLQPKGRWKAFSLVAVGCLMAGAGGTIAIQHVIDSPPEGPAGTYGAVEEINFTGEPEEVTVEASLIAHTWGTETVLEIDGLEPGESFSVVLVAEDGQEYASGTFLGSELLIECRMNAAVMRDQVERVEITAVDGNVITSAELPEAIDPEAD